MFSLSGKSKNQIPCFPCAVATLFFYFSICEKTTFNSLMAIPPQPGYLKGKSLTVIINRPRVYICQADININTTQVEPLSYDGSFNLKIMSCQNSLTIPWHDITKFPNISLTLVKWPKFPDIFSKFPDLEKILFFPGISVTRGNPEFWSVLIFRFGPRIWQGETFNLLTYRMKWTGIKEIDYLLS